MTESRDKTREDDSFIRKIFLALMAIIIVQGGSFIYLVGVVVNQQDINTLNIEKLLDMKDTLTSINTQTTIMASSMSKLADTVTKVAYEQQRRTPIVNQAQDFMIEHGKDHVRKDR